jgi:hypothetical protein
MIFEPFSPDTAPAAPPTPVTTVAEMILACADEARRIAVALSDIDHAVAEAIMPLGDIPHGLQGIDLLRQEAEGLAAIMRLIVEDPTPDRTLQPEIVAKVLVLSAQHDRLHQNRES